MLGDLGVLGFRSQMLRRVWGFQWLHDWNGVVGVHLPLLRKGVCCTTLEQFMLVPLRQQV